MGLDMFFYAGKYFDSDDRILEIIDLPLFLEVKMPSMIAEVEVGCMRKANHIHGWIIENLADGQDNCQRINFTLDDLTPLKEACEELIQIYNTRGEEWVEQQAKDILPTVPGFFFGSLDYDDGYIEDCEYFLKIYETISDQFFEDNEYFFYYQASW